MIILSIIQDIQGIYVIDNGLYPFTIQLSNSVTHIDSSSFLEKHPRSRFEIGDELISQLSIINHACSPKDMKNSNLRRLGIYFVLSNACEVM